MIEITAEERKKLEHALNLIADVQIAFTRREDKRPREERNTWWSELYQCRVNLANYLCASKRREGL